jgi:hypothetical protein
MAAKGTGAARIETLALDPGGTRSFRRQVCESCAKETIFQALKCLSCGAIAKLRNKRGEIIKYDLKSIRQNNYKLHRKIGKYVRSLRADRDAYLKRQAEASRQKWEGTERAEQRMQVVRK